MTIRVFLIDDHRTVLWGLQRLIDGERPRMEIVGTATNPAAALLSAPACAADVMLLDLDIGGRSSIEAIPRLIQECCARVLILTGVRDADLHDQAVVAGACGVVTKEDSAETILKAIEKAAAGELWLDRASAGRVFVALSGRGGPKRADPTTLRIESLTARERQIVEELSSDAGATTRQIAARLAITEHTLRNHLTSIYDKLGVGSRVELWAFASKHGLARKGD